MEKLSLAAVKTVNEGVPDRHPNHQMLEDSRTSISHIGRVANQSTDSLARLGAEQSESKPCPQPGNST